MSQPKPLPAPLVTFSKDKCRAEEILKTVADGHDMTLGILLSDDRRAAVVVVRHAAIFLAHHFTGLSLSILGEVFHKERTAIGYAVHQCQIRAEQDAKFKTLLDGWMKFFEEAA